MIRLLIIDDEPRIARALEFAFATNDVQIVAVTDLTQIEAQAEQANPDAILLDIGLRQMNGLEVCRRLKDDDRFRNVPILLVSGQADPSTKAAGFAAGADDFVAKPFIPTELLARVQAQVRRRTPQ